MPRFFIDDILAKIIEFDLSPYTSMISQLTNPEEKSYVNKSIFELLYFLIQNDKFILPSEFYHGYIYRADKMTGVDKDNGYITKSKSSATNCPAPYNSNEAIWFQNVPPMNYLDLSEKYAYGMIGCRKIKDVNESDKELILFILTNNNFLIYNNGN